MKTTQKITLMTRLDKGITGHADRTPFVESSFPLSPRGLIAAVRTLPVSRRRLEQRYGNIGCGRSWIEIAGKAVDEGAVYRLIEFVHQDDNKYSTAHFLPTETRTAKARAIIAEVMGASYVGCAVSTGGASSVITEAGTSHGTLGSKL